MIFLMGRSLSGKTTRMELLYELDLYVRLRCGAERLGLAPGLVENGWA